MAEELWNKFKESAAFALYAPFVFCLAAGNLDSQTFRHFLGQELEVFKASVQAFSLFIMLWNRLTCLLAFNQQENPFLGTHRFYKYIGTHLFSCELITSCYELQVEIIRDNATSKFIEFLLTIASGEVEVDSVLYKLVAITAFARLCGHISEEISFVLDLDDTHPYQKWFNAEVYKTSILAAEGAMGCLSASLTDNEFEVVEKLYHRALKLAVKLFAAQPISQQTVVPLFRAHVLSNVHNLMLFYQFNKTCLFQNSKTTIKLCSIFRGTDKSFQLWRSSKCPRTSRGTCKKIYNTRLEQMGLLQALLLDNIKDYGRDIILHDGCISFLEKIVKNDKPKAYVHVIMDSRCGDVIRSALYEGLDESINVDSNELIYEESVTTGYLKKKVETAIEKLKVFKEIIENQRKSSEEGNKVQVTVYIGGSRSDILCLLEADIGIVMLGLDYSITDAGDHFGVISVPLFSAIVWKQKQKQVNNIDAGVVDWKSRLGKGKGIVYTVSSWTEIRIG
ncbi:hypothetical protein UlMin_045239 [Ulmus minor]